LPTTLFNREQEQAGCGKLYIQLSLLVVT